MEQDIQQSLWNIDGAEYILIFQIKFETAMALKNWDLEGAYRKVRLLRQELDAKLVRTDKKIIYEFEKGIGKKRKKTEKQEVDEMVYNLDQEYSSFVKIDDPTDKQKSDFYQSLEKFYMHLCYLMKKHGIYFREGEDMRLAVLKR